MLPDLLANDLDLVICGTAAGSESARRALYYAKPGNRFWKTLHATGLTPRLLEPSEFRNLLGYRIGLTDLAKGVAGMDRDLDQGDFDIKAFRAKIAQYQPRYLCFNGKKAAKLYLQPKKVVYGPLPETIKKTRLYVAPSTSGLASRYWDEGQWRALARLCRAGLDRRR